MPVGGWSVFDIIYGESNGASGNPFARVTLDGSSMSLLIEDQSLPDPQGFGIATQDAGLGSTIWVAFFTDVTGNNIGAYDPSQWNPSPEPATWILLGAGMCFGVVRSRRWTRR